MVPMWGIDDFGNFVDFFVHLGENIAQWYSDVITTTVSFMLETTTPTPEELRDSLFAVGLGGTFQLAMTIVPLVVVGVGFFVLLTVRKDHSLKIGRIITSLLGLALFARFFYPVYGWLYSLQQTLTQLILNLATGEKGSTTEAINNALLGADPISTIFAAGLGWLLSWICYVEVLGLRTLMLTFILAYPIILALRPLGGVINVLFHAANASILVVLAAPPIMAFFLLLPLIAGNFMPGAPLMAGAAAVVGGAIAVATPIVLFVFTFMRSNKVFGAVDSKVRGAVDVGSMPAVDMKDINRDIDANRPTQLGASSSSGGGGNAPKGSLMSDIKTTGVTSASTALVAAGHPEMAAVVKVADKAATNAVRKVKAEGGG